jgi:hypothetical protein
MRPLSTDGQRLRDTPGNPIGDLFEARPAGAAAPLPPGHAGEGNPGAEGLDEQYAVVLGKAKHGVFGDAVDYEPLHAANADDVKAGKT